MHDLDTMIRMNQKAATHTCEFVLATDLFRDFPAGVWEQLVESDPDFTWGSNNRSMVTVERVLDHMNWAGIEYPNAFKSLCDKVGRLMYVDLEN